MNYEYMNMMSIRYENKHYDISIMPIHLCIPPREIKIIITT